MEIGFAMPHLTEVKAITEPWEKQVTGADQLRFAKWADKLGYAMISVPDRKN